MALKTRIYQYLILYTLLQIYLGSSSPSIVEPNQHVIKDINDSQKLAPGQYSMSNAVNATTKTSAESSTPKTVSNKYLDSSTNAALKSPDSQKAPSLTSNITLDSSDIQANVIDDPQSILERIQQKTASLQETRDVEDTKFIDKPSIGVSFFIAGANSKSSNVHQKPTQRHFSNATDPKFRVANSTTRYLNQNPGFSTDDDLPKKHGLFLDLNKLKRKINKESQSSRTRWKSMLKKLVRDIDAYKRTLRKNLLSDKNNVKNTELLKGKAALKETSLESKGGKKDFIVEVEDDDDQGGEDGAGDYVEEITNDDAEGVTGNRRNLKDLLDDDLTNPDEEEAFRPRGRRLSILTLFEQFLRQKRQARRHQRSKQGYEELLTNLYSNTIGDGDSLQDDMSINRNIVSQPFDLDQGFISGNRRRLGQKLFLASLKDRQTDADIHSYYNTAIGRRVPEVFTDTEEPSVIPQNFIRTNTYLPARMMVPVPNEQVFVIQENQI
eukprot:TCONS_00066104-protein